MLLKNQFHRYVVRSTTKHPLACSSDWNMFLNILLALKIRTIKCVCIYIYMHSVLSQKNSKFRAVSSGMENCTTSHVCDSPVDLPTAATLRLEINKYEGSRVRWFVDGFSCRGPKFAASAVHMGCVMNTVTLGQVSLSSAVSFLPSLLSFNECCTFSLLLSEVRTICLLKVLYQQP